MIFLDRYSGPTDPPPLHWKQHGKIALVACPDGHVKTLVEHIVKKGVVNPSLRCSICGWRAWVELRGWRT